MENSEENPIDEVVKIISQERVRTNILRLYEQKTIAFLIPYIPSWVSSDMLTGIGFFGNLLVFGGFLLADYLHVLYLLVGVLGFMINWFGDSLDGRIAYYRKNPHKWYGFSLDLTIDWLGTVMIGLGFMMYADSMAKFLGYVFVVLYGWEIIITLIRYRITGQYSIDSGIFGPTEARIIISIILILEILFQGSINYFLGLTCIVLFILNITDTLKLLRIADDRDRDEKEKKGR